MATRIKFSGLFLVIAVSIAFGISFRSPSSDELSAQIITQKYHQDLELFIETTASLQEQAKQLSAEDAESVDLLREALIKARNQFKRVEYLMANLEAEFVKDWINGAPLLQLERNAPSMLSIMEPEGLQILDELIFGDEVLESKEEIVVKSALLASKAKHYYSFQSRRKCLADFEIFEAVREELVRILTLGLTGFDTPLSGNTMDEAEIAFSALKEAVDLYLDRISAKNAALSSSIEQTFNDGLAYLRANHDFDTFNRLYFLKSYINPLYIKIGEAQNVLGLPTIHDISPLPIAVNAQSDNIFSDEFINPGFYTGYGASHADEAIISLGKLLFFDPALSQTNNRSCASCHQPDKAFTDGLVKSIATGYEGTVDRNAPTVINSVFATRYFHDMRTEQLEKQVEHVLIDKKEFQSTYLKLFEKLLESDEYVQLFKDAFPEHPQEPIINTYTFTVAMAAYVKSLSSFNSPFDQYVRGEIDQIDESIINGFNIFMGKGACGTCHFAPTFNGTVPPRYDDSESEVLGVLVMHDVENPVLDPDLGRFANKRPAEKAPFYKHSFKTPTVRNIALTAPYMHNGGYQTLEEVMDFYNRGGGAGMGLDVPYQTLPFDSLNLAESEIQDVISFMEALTDTVGLTSVPTRLPAFPQGSPLNDRKIGGEY